MDIISLFGLILTVAALTLALIQQQSASSHTKELSEIRHSMSTQYIGQFPDYILNVVNLIQSAKKEVLIAYPQVTFGIFSNPEKWLEYKAVLEQKLHQGILVDLLCLDDKERRSNVMEQFSLSSKSWEEKLSEPQFKERLEMFAKYYVPKEAGNVDRETFINHLQHQQKKSLADDFTTAIKTEISTVFAMHFWIVDGGRAIFSVPNFAEGPTELGFLTSDTRLVQALRSIHARYKIRQINIQKI
jgi:hypothetical protein